MLNKFALGVIISIACGAAYSMAGRGGFRHAKLIRRLGCSLLALGLFMALGGLNWGFWWAYLAFWGLNYLALSTYHDYVGFDCWPLTGLFYGLAAFPLIWCGVSWQSVVIRSIFLALTIWWLRSRTGKVFLEEFFSGLLYCGTMFILFL